MKKIAIALVSITLLSNISGAQEKLDIDINKSTIKWIGELTFNFGGHDGFISFKEGYFIKTGDVITGGEFIIDMNSIKNTDIEKVDANLSLVNHLKDTDFFDVKKYPTATLKITSVEYFKNNQARFYANITIKGITKPIKFNVDLDYPNKAMTTRFKIDRREFNVTYQSKFKNSFISDAIGFEVSISL
jgi:polyisoprenoid-binding protein YceI